MDSGIARHRNKLMIYFFPSGYKQEAIRMLQLAWPSVLTAWCGTMLLSVNVIMCGRLGVSELGAVGMASSMLTVLGLDVGFGLCTACDALFSQAFGSSNKKRMGMYVQRSFYVMFMVVLLLSAIYMNSEPLFRLAGISADIAQMAGNYMIVSIPSIFFYYAFMILARYTQTQNILAPPLLAAITGNLISIILNFLALHVFMLNYTASAIAFGCSVLAMLAMQFMCIWHCKIYQATWDGWQAEALFDVCSFLKLGLCGVMIVSLEQWLMEASVLIAALLGTIELGAQSIMVQYEALTASIQVGLSVAVSIRVGQHIGAGDVQAAWTAMWVAMSFVPVIGILVAVLYITFCDQLPWLFTEDRSVATLTSSMLPLLTGVFVSDVVSNVLSGTVRGLGRHEIGGLVCLLTTYGLNMPVGLCLAFLADYSLAGIWLGFLLGSSVQAAVLAAILLKMNWHKQSERAEQHAGSIITCKSCSLCMCSDCIESNKQSHEFECKPSKWKENETVAETAFPSDDLLVAQSSESDLLLKRKSLGDVSQERFVSKYDPSMFRVTVIRAFVIYAVLIAMFVASSVYHFAVYDWPWPQKNNFTAPLSLDLH